MQVAGVKFHTDHKAIYCNGQHRQGTYQPDAFDWEHCLEWLRSECTKKVGPSRYPACISAMTNGSPTALLASVTTRQF